MVIKLPKIYPEMIQGDKTDTQMDILNSVESNEDSGFLSGTCNSATFSSYMSEDFSNTISDDNIPTKLSADNTECTLSKNLDQLTLGCTCSDASLNSVETKTNQEPWELYFTQNEDGDTLLHTAIILNMKEATVKIINEAPHPCLFDILNDDCQTALHLAVLTNQPKVVRQLVLAGADLSIRNFQGDTALHLACSSGALECAKAMTESIVTFKENHLSSNLSSVPLNLEQRNYNGETGLHIAASKDHVDLVRLLVESGTDLEAREYLGGRTALHLALQNRCLKTIFFLVQECQPHLDATTYSGCTSYQIANCVDVNIAQELLNRGATQISDDEDDEMCVDDFREMSGFVATAIAL